MTSILYAYDVDGWAIHKVGELWLGRHPNVKVTFRRMDSIQSQDLARYDILWFGFATLFADACASGLLKWSDLGRTYVVVHDPAELFPQSPDWKDRGIKPWPLWPGLAVEHWTTKLLLQHVRVAVISDEMRTVLVAEGFDPPLISTMSDLPLRDGSFVQTGKCRVLSVFHDSPRKNRPLLERVRAAVAEDADLEFTFKIGRDSFLEADQYRQMLDDHDVYICTSVQEGGPLPAMDALARGAIVLTTPVGQVQDLIHDGVNGFVCRDLSDFVTRLEELASNPDELHAMRLRSLDSLPALRNAEQIQDQVDHFLSVAAPETRGGWVATARCRWEIARTLIRLERLALRTRARLGVKDHWRRARSKLRQSRPN